MTPVQRITLTCRQTGEQAGRLLGWLEHDQAYALQRRGLRDEIDSAIGRLAEIRHAVDLPPSVGIVGARGAGKTELIAALASLRQQALVAEFSGGQIDLNVIDAVLPSTPTNAGATPGGEHPGIGLVLRFSAIEGPVAPKGLPVRLGLLSQTDLVRIIARSYHTHFPAAHRVPPTAASIGEAFSRAERALIAQSVVGLSARDIVDLRDHLHGFYPESATLRALTAGGYWDQLGELAAHLPDLERRRLLGLLWTKEPGLTRLFGRLCDGLERLGHAPEVFAPIEALATKERGTGWVVPHPRSIVAARTLYVLGHTQEQTQDDILGQTGDEKLRIAGRYGQIVEIERSVVAGLAAELPLRLASPQLSALKPAQILEFPSPPVLVDFDPEDAASDNSDGAVSQPGASLSNCAALFAHTKANYLLERACQRHDITSLVVCVDPLTVHDDDLSPAVAEWIESTQGNEPHQRERLQTGLFVVGTKLDQLGLKGQAAGAQSIREAAQRWGDQLGAKLNDLGVDQEWPLEWTPGRAFHNIYLCQRPVQLTESTGQPGGPGSSGLGPDSAPESAPRSAIGQAGALHPGTSMALAPSPVPADGFDADTVLKAPQLARFVENPGRTWSGVTAATDGGVGHLLSGLVSAVQASAKHRQLNTHLVELRRRLRSRLLRLHHSNDPSQIAEWRRQQSIVAQGRLHRVVQADRMHVLHLGLAVTEQELSVLYVGSQQSSHASQASQANTDSSTVHMTGHMTGGRRIDAATCERLAVATIEYWLQAIRQVARSARFCRSVGVSQPVLQHMVDEISIGATRLGIAMHLSETFKRAAQAPTQQRLTEPYFAIAAVRLIGCYIERLALPGVLAAEGRSHAIAALSAPQSAPRRHLAPVDRGVPSGGIQASGNLVSGNLTMAAADAITSARVEDDSQTGIGRATSGTARAWASAGMAHTAMASGASYGSFAATPVVGARDLDAQEWARDWARDWSSAYANLVEANIAAAAHLTGGADQDRALGELLAGFLASPLEVEP